MSVFKDVGDFDYWREAVEMGVAKFVRAEGAGEAHVALHLEVDVAAHAALFADLAAHEADVKKREGIDWPAFRARRERLLAHNEVVTTTVSLMESPLQNTIRRECGW